MVAANAFQQVSSRRHVALGVVDLFSRALRTVGQVPTPLGAIRCQVVEQIGPSPQVYEPPLDLQAFRNGTGFLILDGTCVRAGSSDPPCPLGNGAYRVRVGGAFYQERDFVLDWPPPARTSRLPMNQPGQADNVELLPSAAYPFPDFASVGLQLGPTLMRGTLCTAAGDPLPNVLVQIVNLAFLAPIELPPLTLADWPFLQARTDARGDFVLVLPNRRYFNAAPESPAGPNPPPLGQTLTLRVHYATGVRDILQDVLLGSEHSVRSTAMRGQVLGAGRKPIAGAVITTSVSPATSRTRADGKWFLSFELDQPDVAAASVTVTTPDGQTQTHSSASVKQRATNVVPTFRFS